MWNPGSFGRFILPVTVAVTLSIEATPGVGDPISGLRPGDRVRVGSPRRGGVDLPTIVHRDAWDSFGTSTLIIGTVSEIRNDTLVMVAEEDRRLLTIPLPEVGPIDVWTPGSQANAGVALGFITGAIAGGIIGHRMVTPDPPCQEVICLDLDVGPPAEVIAGVITGGMAGALAGGIIGSSIPAWHWKRENAARLGPIFQGAPNPVVGIGFSARF